jgi:hypothetical protein
VSANVRRTTNRMHLGALLGLIFFGLAAFIFWEYQVIHNLNPWARFAGLRVLSLRGELPEGHSGDFAEPLGFKLQRLEPGNYLIRPAEWKERGSSVDTLMPWTVADFRVRGREWTLEARSGLGIMLIFSAGVVVLLARAAMDRFTAAGWTGSIAWSAFVALAFLQQRRKVRRAFAQLATTLRLTSAKSMPDGV